MTPRKPPNVSVSDWVERQIRTAEAAGAFANLPGAGKPIPDLDRQRDDLAWVAKYLRRENVDTSELLPPALALAKEVELVPERARAERSELRLRRYVEDLNARIAAAQAAPQIGPPVRVRTVDLEAVLRDWRESRAAQAEAQRVAAAAVEPQPRRRRFGRLIRR